MAELMSEIMSDDKRIKTITFYLPQFHCIPENDKAHGKGFTEWTNTKKAKPLFEGHYQPRTPLNENYYNLLDDGVMQSQAKMAKEYGVFGFCYYHYWFKNGKKLLEKPVENMLENPDVDIPFCLSWANENWSKRWDGGNHELIVEQDYGNKSEWESHFQYLLKFFKDDRYITVEGKPLFIIYKPEQIPSVGKMVKYFRKRAVQSGLKGLFIAVQYPKYYCDMRKRNVFDMYIEFEPAFTQEYRRILNRGKFTNTVKKVLFNMHLEKLAVYLENRKEKKVIAKMGTERKLDVRDYDSDWKEILERKVEDEKMALGGFVDWDNTARNTKGVVYKGATPKKFGRYIKQLREKAQRESRYPVIFLNAWNEWAEGAYLEPDEKYGYGYLEEMQKNS